MIAMSVGVLSAESAEIQFDLLPVAPDVVAKPPTAEPEAVLSLAGWDAFRLLDGMAAGPVVRIGLEDGECLGKRLAGLLWVLAREFLQQTIEGRRCADIKGPIHFLEGWV